MLKGYRKYKPFTPVKMESRDWPNKVIDKAPVWCSVDLRDGNQALVDPMNLEEKLRFFKTLVKMGFKEIEVGFPSASETEYEICRALIEGGHIPDDVTVQVLVQARPHLIERTFEAIKGAKNVIVHFYNSTSTLQRKVVFQKDMEGIIKIAVDAARLIKSLGDKVTGMNIRYEYSPESFSGTETDNAVEICRQVMEALEATRENPVILNLPSTVEMCTPNTYADQVEYFIKHLPNREKAIISIHPHNDRGTGVACAELAVMAGAERVEGTLFGNGERTGNLDIVTMGLNMYSQGVDPELDFSDLPRLKAMYEQCTDMHINERHPYVGELVFTAFSGSHQDAINKGTAYMEERGSDYWEIPYLPIDPADIGRQYEPVIRINSQSGKGGAAYVMHSFGYNLPKAMHPEFGRVVKKACDKAGTELTAGQIKDLFHEEYIDVATPYKILKQKVYEESSNGDTGSVRFEGRLHTPDGTVDIEGVGNGPIDAFFGAIKKVGIDNFEFISYNEHAISSGADAKAVAYIELQKQGHSESVFGVGMASNINRASIKGVVSAINRALRMDRQRKA